ncbi:stalk domain-containing protein [Brevibacillus sp. NPDC058079]|uniref:stalk domain-containing protein n=1 Tax=Brevibacillus sp. NPDC058079 TaxID=3346330 RepID=UPI0036ED8C63
MKRWTKKWVPSLLTAVMLSSIPVSVLSSTAYAETVSEGKQELTYEQQRKAIEDALEATKEEFSKETLKETIDTYLQLPTLEDYPKIDYVNDKKDFAEKILAEINRLSDDVEKLEVTTYFATQVVDLIYETKSFNDFGVANSLIKLLPEGAARTELASKLEISKNILPKGPSDYIDWNNPPNNLNDFLDPPPNYEYDNLPDDFDKEAYQNGGKGGTPPPPASPYDRTEIQYRTEGGKCYKILEHYKNGKLMKTEKQSPDKMEMAFCGTAEPPKSGTSFNSSKSTYTGFDPYNQKSVEQIQQQENTKQPIVDQITVQYTFDKSSESPYFYDTGIAIAENKTVTYAKAKDALHMISVQAKGKFVEDKGKSLALINGKIILVTDPGKAMPFGEFATMFSETNVGVRALDTRSGEQVELADLVEIKGIKSVFIKGKEIKLVSKPIVDNSIALFPIEQIAKALGGTTEKNGKTLVVKNKSQTLIYEDGSTTILSNDKKVDAYVPIRINKDGILMAPIRALVDAFDLSVEMEDANVMIR